MPIQKKRITEPLTPDEAVVLLERFCDYQDRYTKEIRQKMTEYQLDPRDAETILQYLIDENLINDARYADAWVRGKVRQNNWGFIKIRLTLGAKGIEHKHIEKAIAGIPQAEYEAILRKLAERRQTDVADESLMVQRQKMSLTLTRAGFELDLVIKTIDEVLRDVKAPSDERML